VRATGPAKTSRSGEERRRDPEVDFGPGDLVEIVCPGVQRDVLHDLDDLRVVAAGRAHGLHGRVGDVAARSLSTDAGTVALDFHATARFGSTANGLSPSHCCIELATSRAPVSSTLAPSFATVVTPIQIEVIVRRSVET
jgi:hypothetical protein